MTDEFDRQAALAALKAKFEIAEEGCYAAGRLCRQAGQRLDEFLTQLGANPFAPADKLAEQLKQPIVRVHAKHRSDEQWDADQARQAREYPHDGYTGL